MHCCSLRQLRLGAKAEHPAPQLAELPESEATTTSSEDEFVPEEDGAGDEDAWQLANQKSCDIKEAGISCPRVRTPGLQHNFKLLVVRFLLLPYLHYLPWRRSGPGRKISADLVISFAASLSM